MKQKAVILIAFVGLLTLAGCQDRVVAPTQVPQPIQLFVQQTFPGQTITYAEKDWEFFGKKYDVVLADGTQISFDTKNMWDKIESVMNPIPTALIPAPIAAYVTTNFPAVGIVKLEKERYGYDVDLANGLELKFNKQGALMEMDD